MAPRTADSMQTQQVNSSPLIYVIESDQIQAELLNKTLLDNGYRVQLFTEADTLFFSACTDPDIERPSVVIMDIIFSGDELISSFTNDIVFCKNSNVPAIVTSKRDDITARLASLRAGAKHYLSKPVNNDKLIGLLDEITGRLKYEPYRVLLVDDDEISIKLHKQILTKAGMVVQALLDPIKTLDVVKDFKPDLILLDVYMPEINGAELVAVLRDSGFLLPVLFLSGETDLTQQLLALDNGGDDFIVKPIQPENLVATVLARAKKSRRSNNIYYRLENTLYEREREHLALDHHCIISVADNKGNIIYVNERFCEASGYSREELLGKNHRIIKSDIHTPEFYQNMWSTISEGNVWQGETCNKRKDGSLFWVESTITPFLDTTGEPYQYVAIRTDITDIKKSEQVLRTIVDSTSLVTGEAFFKNTVRCMAESMNVRFSFIAKMEADDASTIKTIAIWDTDQLIDNFSYPIIDTPCEQVMNTGLSAYSSKVAETFPKDFWLKENGIESYIGIPLFDSNDDFLGHMGILDDKPISNANYNIDLLKIFAASVASEMERAQSDSALQNSESRLKFLVSSSPVTIYTCEATPPFAATYISPNVKQLMGYEPEQFTENAVFWADNIHPEDQQQVFDNLPQLFEHAKHQHEYRFCKPDGSYAWMHDEMRLIKNAAGEPIKITGYWADISERKATEQLLELNKERLRRGQVFANIGTWDWNIQTGDLFWSERIAPLFGYADGELATSYENFINAVHPDDRQRVSDAVTACVEQDTAYDIEHRVLWPDGTIRWLHERGAVIRDAEGMPLQMLGVVQDIDDRKQAELALLEREHQLREAQTMAHIGNWKADLLTGKLDWSDEIYRIFGYEPGALEPSIDIFNSALHPDDKSKVRQSEKLAEETGLHDVIHRIIRPDGSIRHVHELAQAVTDASGQLIELAGTVQDVTEQIEAEAALAENEDKFRGLYEQSPVGIALNEMDGSFVEANQGFLDLIGYTDKECRALTYWQLTPEEYATQEARQLESLNSSGHYGPYEKEYIHKDGHRVAVLLNGSIVNDRDGNKRIWSIVQDISKRKNAELAMQESEERFAFAVEGAGDGIWDWDMKTSVMQFSQLYMEMLGYAQNELPQHVDTWVASVHPDDLARIQKNLQEYLEGKTTTYHVELRLRCKDGSYKWILCRGTIVGRDEEGNAIRMIGIHSDITEQKRNEAAVKESQQRMALHVQRTPLGVIEWDNNFCVTEWNSAAESIFKYSKEEVMGRHATDIIVPDNLFTQVGQVWEELLTLKGGLRSSNENITKHGDMIFCEWYNTPLINDDGKVIGVASLVQDITKQKNAEINLIRAKVEAEYANNAKSEFLSSMSHELRTPMNAILGFGQLLEFDDDMTDLQNDNVQEILTAGHHLLNLINEVLDLAKIESGQIELSLEPVDVCQAVEECLNLMEPLALKRDIRISHSGLKGVAVRADHTRFKQVLINLLSNAIKYNHDGGTVRLDVEHIENDRLKIIITDTGIGVPEDGIADLFQPFNRLNAEKTSIEGTGIGLTITRRIVELMGGSINVKSEIGVGSSFWIELPLETIEESDYIEVIDDSAESQPIDATIKHTVLYIEDNPANLKLVAQILGHRKHIHLLTAHTPEIGIELAKSRLPELILLDINMPNIDGYEVMGIFNNDSSLRNIPVVAVTANAMSRDIDRGNAAGFIDYVTKPIDVPKFLDIVDKHLRGGN